MMVMADASEAKLSYDGRAASSDDGFGDSHDAV